MALSGCQLLALDLAHVNVKDDSSAFSPLGPMSHGPPSNEGSGPGDRADRCGILSLDIAVRKPLIATVGKDNTVRIWNYIDRTCDIVKVFPEGPTAIAFHPSGFQLLVGFTDRLRLLNVRAFFVNGVKLPGCMHHDTALTHILRRAMCRYSWKTFVM